MVGGMIEKVLFDLGNVLLRFDFDRAHQGMAKYGARIEDLESEAMTALKIDYETGRITKDEMFQRTVEMVGYDGPRDHFERSWQDIFEENTPMTDFLKSLRARGIGCYLLSNSNDMHVRFVRETYDVLEHFNDIIFSHEAKAMKPGEAIFEMAIEQFGLIPEKTAYIDDLADNIATGRRLGFQSVHYNPYAHEESETELIALGLIPS
ncbi:MAG: HAD superfamily hydrolase (TIGR01509 family) [Verrucomicrobiales bacterium]|jgi:HAD superfamily hydrolase (TIGR01509 family)